MKIKDINITELKMYKNNPRKNDEAVEYIGLDLLKADTDYERVKFLFNTILRERQLITYMKIKGCQTVGDNQVKA